MAMTVEGMKSKIVAQLASRGFNVVSTGPDSIPWMERFIEAVAAGVIQEIQTNASTSLEGEQIL